MNGNQEFYVVWNEKKTQGFATVDKQLAYEARKGSDTNCYDADGIRSNLAVTFCDETGDENCTIQNVGLSAPQYLIRDMYAAAKELVRQINQGTHKMTPSAALDSLKNCVKAFDDLKDEVNPNIIVGTPDYEVALFRKDDIIDTIFHGVMIDGDKIQEVADILSNNLECPSQREEDQTIPIDRENFNDSYFDMMADLRETYLGEKDDQDDDA